MLYNILYKTTNLLNGKIYIGIHQTDNLDDGYLGSGKLILRAIEKYGKENFRRENLKFFETYSEAADEERNIVSEDFIKDNYNYNICVGGGFPPRRCGEDHPQYGTKRPDTSKRMKENNPVHRDGVLNKLKNRVTVRDKDGNSFSVLKDDPRYISGELVPFNKGRVTVKDIDGNIFQCYVDDPRYISGELVHITTGSKRGWSSEEIDEKYSTRRGRKYSEEEYIKRQLSRKEPWNKGKVLGKRDVVRRDKGKKRGPQKNPRKKKET